MATMTINRFQAKDGNILKSPRVVGRKPQAAPTQVTTTLFAGLLESNPGTGYGLYQTYSFDDLVSNWNGAVTQGLRMCSIDTAEDTAGNVAYLAVYTQPNPTGGFGLWATEDWTSFMQKFNDWGSIARLLDFDVGTKSGARTYIGTWGGTPANQVIAADLSWDEFVAKWKALSGVNMRLMKVQPFPAGDTFHLTGLFEAGTGGYAFLGVTDKASFINYYKENQAAMELVDFHVFDQPPARWYFGVWRETQLPHAFIYDLDWGTFVNQVGALEAQNYRLKKAVRYPNPIELPEPNWAQFYASQLTGTGASGYAWAVAQNGALVSQGAAGDARRAADGERPWQVSTRMNLASVSKSVTAVAMLKLLAANGISVNSTFYPHISSKCPQHGKDVDTVTFANLLTMMSGMEQDPTLYLQPGQDIWSFLSTYLQKDLVAKPGVPPLSIPTPTSRFCRLSSACCTKAAVATELRPMWTTSRARSSPSWGSTPTISTSRRIRRQRPR
jgi:hypothetical protein